MYKKAMKATYGTSTIESYMEDLEATGYSANASKRRGVYLEECQDILGCPAGAMVSSQETLAKAIIDLKFVVPDSKYRDQLSNSLYRYFAITNGYECEKVDKLIRSNQEVAAYYMASLMKNMNTTR